MSQAASALFVGGLAFSLLAAIAGWLAWTVARSPAARLAARGLGALAGLTVLGAWGLRWATVGHLPIFGTYESALSLAVAVLAASWLVDRRHLPSPWAVTGLLAAGLLAHGRAFSAEGFALTISERSWVVDVHSVLAWGAFGALTVNCALAAALLLRSTPAGGTAKALSTSLSVGFFLHTGMLASGSLYKFLLFGELWSFDPVETLGFAAWVAYGTLLHLHLMGGWEGRRLAAWCLGLFVLLVVSYRGIVYFPAWSTYHIFDMDLRMHITGTGGAP